MGSRRWLILAGLALLLWACSTYSQTVRVDSFPRDAMVYLEGSYRGLTPLEIDVPLESRSIIRGVEVLVIKEGYRAERGTITLGEDNFYFFWLRPSKEPGAP